MWYKLAPGDSLFFPDALCVGNQSGSGWRERAQAEKQPTEIPFPAQKAGISVLPVPGDKLSSIFLMAERNHGYRSQEKHSWAVEFLLARVGLVS